MAKHTVHGLGLSAKLTWNVGAADGQTRQYAMAMRPMCVQQCQQGRGIYRTRRRTLRNHTSASV